MKSLVQLFLKSTCFFFVLLLAWNFILFEEHLTLLVFLYRIVLPAVFTSVCLTTIHFVLARQKGVKHNYSAYQAIELNVSSAELHLSQLAEAISRGNNWKLMKCSPNKVVLKSTFNSPYSFGELITLIKGDKILSISSSPVFFATLFDFGKGYENIRHVASLVRG